MARGTGALALIALLALVWVGQRNEILLDPLTVSAAEELGNPGRAALNFQTGPLQQAEATPTLLPPPALPSPIIVAPNPTQNIRPTPLPSGPGQSVTPRSPVPGAPPGQPPGLTPQPGNAVVTPTIPPLPPGAPGGGQSPAGATARPAQPTVINQPPAAPTVAATPPSQQATVAATSAAEASPAVERPAATSSAVRSLTGKIVDRDAANLIIEIPGRGTVTVTPGLDTDIRRDGSTSSLASLVIGDTATLVLGDDNQLVRILASSTPPEPESSNSSLTLLWQALLGLLMMGIVLVIDKDLRVKFMASLLEPSGQYRPGKGK